ncbi:DUF2784 family protein [Bdellovibrio sp. HCB2-146]|uniref:DUF2784 family protein n=1 Tax=Bdellovibrio sp. HCB2-146 TaxID=3394362 RepID=UPI0039BD5D96
MSSWGLHVLDYFLHILHFAVIISNLFLWWFPSTLKTSQITIVGTLISWLVCGYFYGWGYCFLTDWQWQVKDKLGEENLPYSYITYLLHKLGIYAIDPRLVDNIVAVLMIVAIIGCGIQSMRYQNKKAR